MRVSDTVPGYTMLVQLNTTMLKAQAPPLVPLRDIALSAEVLADIEVADEVANEVAEMMEYDVEDRAPCKR